MRVAHLTDLHVERPPGLGECFNKRLAGAVNLYVLGRHHHFSPAAQAALVPAVLAARPDVVLCTGDLTATATEAEFVAANALLAPLRERLPWLAIPGNHDVYTGESVGRYARYFGECPPVRVEAHGGWELVLLDVCHPDWLSRGWAGPEALADLERALSASSAPALLALHYPLRGRRGEPYGPAARACVDAREIEAIILRHPRVKLVVHGHEHHGFRTELVGEDRSVPILDPGASGYAHLPARGRTAHFCVYELDGNAIVGVERLRFDGAAFVPEPGGAFATGG